MHLHISRCALAGKSYGVRIYVKIQNTLNHNRVLILGFTAFSSTVVYLYIYIYSFASGQVSGPSYSIGASKIRIGLWGLLYYNYNRNPTK